MHGRWGTTWLGLCLTTALAHAAPTAKTPEAPADKQSTHAAEQPELLARGRLGWGNDQFYLENGDDVGFTNDFLAEAQLVATHDAFALRTRYRLLAERYGPRRTDELSCRLLWLHRFEFGTFSAILGPSFTLAASGNYGGAKLQNSWHRAIDDGYTFGQGLADQYPDYGFGAGPGAVLGLSWSPVWWFGLALGSELVLAFGPTGRSQAALYDAVEFTSNDHGFRGVLALGIDLERTWTNDPYLEIPGGYETARAFWSPHLRLAGRGDSWEVGYQAHSNIGGADTHFGLFYVLVGGGPGFRDEHSLR